MSIDESRRATEGTVVIDGREHPSLYPAQMAAFDAGALLAGDLAAAFRAASRRRIAFRLTRLLGL